MTAPTLSLDSIREALGRHGLIERGGFNFEFGEEAPAGPSGELAKAALLVGSAGAAYWPRFRSWVDGQATVPDDPLDSWSRMVIGEVAEQFGARAVSPSDRPYLPFQRWARRAEGLRPSPLGILMHPDFGLWHSYRGALLFDFAIEAEPVPDVVHLCDACLAKPCLKACPVGAHSTAGFAHSECLSHVRGIDEGACRSRGCLTRNACPFGADYRYPAEEVQAFHMRAFAGL